MFRTRTDLSVRADRIALAGAREPVWKDVLYSEADTDAWRIVEVSSLEGKPFDIELIWSAANGSGANALITVPHASRICVFARTVQVRVRAGETLDEVILRSYAVGAAHMGLGLVRSESIAVDPETGEIHDLTIRSFGVLRAIDTPSIEVVIEPDEGPAVNGSDAVMAAVAAAAWLHADTISTWPTNQAPTSVS